MALEVHSSFLSAYLTSLKVLHMFDLLPMNHFCTKKHFQVRNENFSIKGFQAPLIPNSYKYQSPT